MFRKLLRKAYKAFQPAYEPEPVYMRDNPRYADYEVGEWTYGKPDIRSWPNGGRLRIGRFCSIAEGVVIFLGGEHRLDWITTYPFSDLFVQAKSFSGHPASKGDVIIGNDVWIGWNAFIRSGVHVGDGAVIGAHSLVTKDVAPYSIVAGNPAKHLKFRFSDASIQALQEIAWWNWPPEKIQEAWPLLLSPNLEAFIAKYTNPTNSTKHTNDTNQPIPDPAIPEADAVVDGERR